MAASSRLIAALERLARDEPLGDLLRDSHGGPPAALAIADALRGTTSRALQNLDLYGMQMGNDGALPLLLALSEHPGCVAMDLGANHLSNRASAALAPLLLQQAPPPPKRAVEDDNAAAAAEEEEEFGGGGEDEDDVRHVPIRHLRLARNSIDCSLLLSPSTAPTATLALSSLALSFNPLGSSGGAALSAALGASRLPELETLQLHGCRLGEEGTRALAAGLPAASVQHLDLCDNQMHDDGGCAIGAVLPACHALRELLLGSNGLGDATAHAIATALMKSRPRACELRLLSLARNKLRDAGGAALAESLGSGHACKRMDTLDLRGNKLGPPSLLSLGDALVANHAVTALDLGGNKRIPAEGLVALSELLAQNRAASRGMPPVELVAPNEAASKVARLRVQRLFTQPSGLAPPEAAEHARCGSGDGRALASTEASRSNCGPSAATAARPLAVSGHTSATDELVWHGRQRGEMETALRGMQGKLDLAGREVARLRHREAMLERALNREVGIAID